MAAVEAAVLLALVILYIWWIRWFFPRFWIVLLAWVVVSHIWWCETPAWLGFRARGFRESALGYGRYVALCAAALIAAGLGFHSIREISLRWAVINFLLYCVWGVFQEYVLNGYFVNRFARFTSRAPLLAAVSFSLAHAPNWFLMIVTGVGGYCAAQAYQRYRNLWFLGLAHGVLGFLIYLTISDSISRHLYVGPKWFRGF